MPTPTPSPAPSWLRRATQALLLVAALVALAQVVFYFCRTVDDAYISLRYAERLVAGDGLTYNDGQPVEGFSNPSWVALQALLVAIGFHGVVATKLLALASHLLLLVGVHRLGRDVLGLSGPSAAAAVALTAASSYVASWSILGLETPLYLALLVWLLVAFHRHLRAPSRRSLVTLAGVTVAFVATRPEAPLYVIAAGAATLLVGPLGRSDAPAPAHRFTGRALALVAPAALAAGLIAALFLARHAYYGLWFPQTYYAKQGAGFDLDHLAPLVAQGATPLEVAFLLGGLLLAAAAAIRARAASLLAVMLTNLFFVASVSVDWMPNHRHFLPLIVLAPLPWLWALARLLALRPAAPRRLGAVALAVATLGGSFLAAQGVEAFTLDSRFSIYDFKSHGRGQDWRRAKSADRWRDALDGLVRTPPAHVAGMSVHAMGMIDQLFRVLEASAEPERSSWFLGRDIGRLGYYSPIQVFETAGLFTPTLTASEAWRRDGTVDRALVDAAFAHKPVVTDLLDGWTAAVARRHDLLARHDVLLGGPGWVVAMRPRDLVRPAPTEVLARYERVARAFDTPFFQATLYGESVGAAVAKRYAWIRPQLLANATPVEAMRAPLAPAEPVELLGGAVRLHGCAVEPPPEPLPGAFTLACMWEAVRPVREDWTVFVHLVDGAGQVRAMADHAPRVGLAPTSRWPVGVRLRDAIVVERPEDLRAQPLSARIGLFLGERRAPATAGPAVDPDGRVIGPTVGPVAAAP